MSWSRELSLDGIAGLSEGVGYLDRMIAGGDRSQRQMMTTGAGAGKRGSSGQQNKNKKAKQTNNSDRKPFQCQTPVVNIDDAAWLADRRRKFPKRGGETSNGDVEEPETHGVGAGEPVVAAAIPGSSLDVESTKESKKQSKSKNKAAKNEPPKQRKTLFEKLMEMDQQSN